MKPSSEVTTFDVLIVGAGIAGLTAAKHLRAAGRNVLILEKSRGLGGRAATRRWDGMPVDHGAQFFTARSPAFKEQVQDWLDRGVCFEWARGLHRATEQGPRPPDGDNFPRYACREGMNSLGRDLAGPDPSFVLRESKVAAIQRHASTWEVRTEDGRIFQARALLMTPPPPQSASLLANAAPDAAKLLQAMTMAPCLALVVRYARRDFPWSGIQAPGHPVVSWIGHDTSKRPELHPDATVLVIHASPQFSENNFEGGESAIASKLLQSASKITDADLSAPSAFFLQRWRYALGSDNNGKAAHLFSDGAPLVLAGDAIAGGKIEGARLSGQAAAQALLA
jgi:renalase